MEDPKITAHKQSIKSMYDQVDKLLAGKHSFKNIFLINQEHNNHKYVFIYEKDGKTIKVSYDEYFDNCYKYAYAIKESLKDIKTGSYVAFKAGNSPLWPYMFWGILMAGYNPIIINPLYSTKDTNRLIKESGAKFIFSEDDDKYDVLSLRIDSLALTQRSNNDIWGTKVGFCTSGTTGDSRIFVFTDENIVRMINSSRKLPDTCVDAMYKEDRGDLRLMCVVPFAHIYGFVAIFLWYTFFGMTIVFPNSLSSVDIQKCALKHKVTHIYGVPLLWDSLTKAIKSTIASKGPRMQKLVQKFIDCNNHIITPAEAGFAASKMFKNMFQKKILGNNIKFCVSGGSALSKETLYTINGIGYTLNNGYGMTEIGVTSVEIVDQVEQRLKGSIGFPLTDIEYKIIDNELCVKSPQIHTYRLVNGVELPPELDKDGYFHTGDIGVLDDTDHAWIKGKNKDVIIGANGENIYPDEIAVKFNNMPFVNKYTVVGLNIKDNELLTLILSLERELYPEEKAYLSKAISIINDSFPNSFKVRKVLISKEDLPVNTSMKIVKHELIKQYYDNPNSYEELAIASNVTFDAFDKNDVSDVQEKVVMLVSKVLNLDPKKIGVSQNIITDLGGDSFVYMSLLSEIENEFKLSVPSELIGSLNTVNDFVLYILKNK